MNNKDMERLKDAIKTTDEWIDNPPENYAEHGDEYSHVFYAIELNTEQVIVMANWWGGEDTERTFFMYDKRNKEIRPVTEMEDEIFREYDDVSSIVEYDDYYIMSRDDEE